MHLHFPSEVPVSWRMTDEPFPVPSTTHFPRGYEMKRAHTQSPAFPGSAGTWIWHRWAPEAAAARELCARQLHQSLPCPHRRFGHPSFDAKPSPGVTALHRGTAGINHCALLPVPSQTASSRQAQLASPTLRPGTATTVALLTQNTQQGMAWLWFQAGEGKIRGMRRGTTTKKSSPSSHKGRRGRAGGRARGGEQEAASALQSRSDPRGTE